MAPGLSDPYSQRELRTNLGQAAADYARRMAAWRSAFVLVNPVSKMREPLEPMTAARVDLAAVVYSNAVLGLMLGRVSRTVVADLDGDVAWLLARLPQTATIKTPSGGRHLLYASSSPPPTRWAANVTGSIGLNPRIRSYDFLSDGAYTLLPPAPGREWTRRGALTALPPAVS